MATVTITIETGNDAFEGEKAGFEVSRILEELAWHFRAMADETEDISRRNLRDTNGNRVGSVVVS